MDVNRRIFRPEPVAVLKFLNDWQVERKSISGGVYGGMDWWMDDGLLKLRPEGRFDIITVSLWSLQRKPWSRRWRITRQALLQLNSRFHTSSNTIACHSSPNKLREPRSCVKTTRPERECKLTGKKTSGFHSSGRLGNSHISKAVCCLVCVAVWMCWTHCRVFAYEGWYWMFTLFIIHAHLMTPKLFYYLDLKPENKSESRYFQSFCSWVFFSNLLWMCVYFYSYEDQFGSVWLRKILYSDTLMLSGKRVFKNMSRITIRDKLRECGDFIPIKTELCRCVVFLLLSPALSSQFLSPLLSPLLLPWWLPRGDRHIHVMLGGSDADRSWWRELCPCLFT